MGNSKFSSITFFYPSKIVGGAEFLFLRLANYLSDDLSISVNYVDYEDGFVAGEVKKNNLKINLIPFKVFTKLTLPQNTVMIAPISSSVDILNYCKGDCNLFFWSIHPMGLKNALTPFKKYSFKSFAWSDFANDIDFMIDKNALVFMDGANLSTQRNIFNFKNTPQNYLPIICLGKKDYLKCEIPTNTIHLGTLGRLSSEKVNPLINVIEHCNAFLDRYPTETIKFHIIGEGEAKHKIDQLALHPNLELLHLGTIIGDELNEYMVNNIHVMFAMGTSTLESASLKIPTILVDLSYAYMPIDNKFRWLYEAANYSVGDVYDVKNRYLHDFEEIIAKIKDHSILKEGDSCYRYFMENHSIENVSRQLLQEVNLSSFTLQDLKDTRFSRFRIISFLRKINKFRKL